MEQKVCNRCGKILPIEEFYLVPSMEHGRDNTCKNCRRELKGRTRTPEILHCPVCGNDLPYYKFIIARKSQNSATLQELQTFCKNILRYSPNYTKEEGIEVGDKEPLR